MRTIATLLTMLALAATAAATVPPPSVITLTELWARGGDDDQDVMFGIPTDVVTDPAGNVYVLDSQLSQVVALAADGRFLGTLGRSGEGPGEFRAPVGLMVLPDGAIAVGQSMRPRFERLTPAGIPDGSFTLGHGGPQENMFSVYFAAFRGGVLLAATATTVFDQTTAELNRVQNLGTYHLDGRPRARLREATFNFDFRGGTLHERELLRAFLLVHAVGPDGRVYVPRAHDEYAIDVYDPDGRLERTLGRPGFTAPRRTARERARLEALADTWNRNNGITLSVRFEPTEMTVGGLFVDDDGHLFVRHAASGRDLPPGVFLRLDEFDPDGRYLGEVHVRAAADPALDSLVWLGANRVAIMRGGALNNLERWRDAPVFWVDEDEVVPEIVVCAWQR